MHACVYIHNYILFATAISFKIEAENVQNGEVQNGEVNYGSTIKASIYRLI